MATTKTVPMTLEASLERVENLVALMKSLKDYKINKNKVLTGLINSIADALGAGDSEMAIQLSGEFFGKGRSILGRFIRNRVVDSTEEGVEPSRFTKAVNWFRQERYHEDIVARVEKHRLALLEAVNIEREGDFSKRIEAYNALMDVIEWAHLEQVRRDNSPKAQAQNGQGQGKKRKGHQAEDDDVEAQQAINAQNQRAQLVAKRQQMAGKMRSLADE